MPDIYVSQDKPESEQESAQPVTPQKTQDQDAAMPEEEKPCKRPAVEYSQVMREEAITRNPFSSFMVRPRGVNIEVQESHEQILLLLRKHIITNVPWILTAIIMIAAPLMLAIVPLIDSLPGRFQLMTLLLWYLLTTGYITEKFLSWYFNVYIITDERIIDVDFLNLLYKNISSAKIENIEDITTETGGAIRSVLNFGNILVQTAGQKPQLEFNDVPHPQKVAKFLNELILEEEREKLEGRVR